jgi:hypothetical protein
MELSNSSKNKLLSVSGIIFPHADKLFLSSEVNVVESMRKCCLL